MRLIIYLWKVGPLYTSGTLIFSNAISLFSFFADAAMRYRKWRELFRTLTLQNNAVILFSDTVFISIYKCFNILLGRQLCGSNEICLRPSPTIKSHLLFFRRCRFSTNSFAISSLFFKSCPNRLKKASFPIPHAIKCRNMIQN